MSASVAYKDPERQRAYARDWIKRNPEKARLAMRKWRRAHRDKSNANRRLYYQRHREQMLAQSAEYHRAHPEVGKARWQNYRARKAAAGGSFTSAQWLTLVATYDGRCAYCGESRPLEPEHKIPLARGGSNEITNIVPACRRCNARKHLLTDEEFRARLAIEGNGP
jgi:5-methylcytosine-specific restriction endonuclease McrA